MALPVIIAWICLVKCLQPRWSQKPFPGNASAISAHEALEMATINGAKAMGWADHIGSIEIGKSADLIAVELGAIESEPLYNLPSQLVYTPMGHQVSHAWVNGMQH